MARTGLKQRLTGTGAALWRGFMGGNRGGIAVWAALIFVPLMGFMGLGVDSARGYLVRARLSQALDAAALAAGKWASNTTKAEEEAAMTFKANFPDGYMDAAVTGPIIEWNALNDMVGINATAVLPTYFVHLLGVNTFTVAASTEVMRKTVYMDIIMSFDVSGSMNETINGVPKIDAAREAAHTLTDSLFGASETKEFLKMGLVTWNSNARILPIGVAYNAATLTSQAVPSYKNPYRKSDGTAYASPYNASPYPSNATFNTVYFANGIPVPLMKQPPSNWTGCVVARYVNNGVADDGDTELGTGTFGGKQWMSWLPATTSSPSMQCTNQGIRRLINVKSTVKSAIDQVINPSNNTSLGVGLVWGWRLLGTTGSPFAGDGTPPPTDPEKELVRAIILMTDGANTQATGDAYRGVLTASGLNSRTQAVATKIKDDGIIIYAIQFGFNDSAQEALMKSIASGPTTPYYQYAPDAPALQMVFKEIGNHLSKLRLSK
jgi:Flp pilus assembly protein TadG